MTVTYVSGDATRPEPRPALIVHICNDIGRWGSGFVVPLGKRYPEAREDYLAMRERVLGDAKFVSVDAENNLVVANMIAQHGIKRDPAGIPPIRYDALDATLARVERWLDSMEELRSGWSVHMPRIGCGLAGGTWQQVQPLVDLHLRRWPVYVYDLPRDPVCA